jgi:hypothetical protein
MQNTLIELSDESVRQTVRRAAEIMEHTTVDGSSDPHASVALYLDAAEEAGISRDAMLQALYEQKILVSADSFQMGEMVFAESEADGNLYPATVIARGPNSIKAAYKVTGEATVPISSVREFAVLPGTRLQFHHPDFLGVGLWGTGRVNQYDPVTELLEMSCGGMSFTVPLSNIRLKKQETVKPAPITTVQAKLIQVGIAAGSAGIVIGGLLTWLLTHR